MRWMLGLFIWVLLCTGCAPTEGLSFEHVDFSQATSFEIRNLCTGRQTVLSDLRQMQLLAEFLNRVSGTPTDAPYSGGCFEIYAYHDAERFFSVSFGSGNTVAYGNYGGGYVQCYELVDLTLETASEFFRSLEIP